MRNEKLTALLRYAAITGNVLFVLWILFNAMDEGFNGSLPEKASMIGLIGLLMLNSALIVNRTREQSFTE